MAQTARRSCFGRIWFLFVPGAVGSQRQGIIELTVAVRSGYRAGAKVPAAENTGFTRGEH